jgi:FKBP-type peptidyl-prolyl cis-trans isomerase SlyD
MSHSGTNEPGNDLTVADDVVVRMDYSLRLDDGELIDSSTEEEPLEFLQGAGEIIPGLEQALYGMSVGEKKKLVIGPDEAYGDLDEDAFQLVPHDLFPDDVEIEEGTALRLINSETGEPVDAYVAEVLEEGVVLDFNHPLAGETLYFDVHIAGLRPATPEEIAHSHVHDDVSDNGQGVS